MQVCQPMLQDFFGRLIVLRAFNESELDIQFDRTSSTARFVLYKSPTSPKDKSVLPSATSTASDTERNPSKHNKTPRPPNSFILYRQHHHSKMVLENPKLKNNQICKLMYTLII